ncbi:MAG: hypothetical protein DMD79_10475 [Candidatus Rokuibacteriota bacterium]|nr:MAG: hypothetical protein DMD79_10475 [Candidatus Rokubacteria bacterium]
MVTTLWKVDDRASYELMREFPQPFAWADLRPDGSVVVTTMRPPGTVTT